jgi:hypothetical protein
MADDQSPAALGAEDPRRLLVTPGDVQAVEAIAPQSEAVGPLARQRKGRVMLGLTLQRERERSVEDEREASRRSVPCRENGQEVADLLAASEWIGQREV